MGRAEEDDTLIAGEQTVIESGSKVVFQEQEFWELDHNGVSHLIGSRCHECGSVVFPPRIVCPACVTDGSMDRIQLASKGVIDSFSLLHVGAPGFTVPYILAWVRLADGPRVLSMITGCKLGEEGVAIGSEVELVIDKIRLDDDGKEVRGYMFRLINIGPKEGQLREK